MLGMAEALRRAVEVITAVAGGTMREAPLDLWPEPQSPRTIFARPERISRLLGVTIERAAVERLLGSVGFVAAPKDDRMAVQVPGWRPDVTREVDLIEEVARLHGYDNFPIELRPYRPTTVPDAPREVVIAGLRRRLAEAGMLEARTLPLGPADGPDAVAVLNPLSADDAHLRSRLLPGLVRRVEHNWSNRNRDVRLFEIGTVFRTAGAGKAPDEHLALAVVLTGARPPAHWWDAGAAPDIDIWGLKYHFESVVGATWPGVAVQAAADGRGWTAQGTDGSVGWAGALEADRPVVAKWLRSIRRLVPAGHLH
jgi:phenylalanyl-tRNA synthetase beta chain